MPLPDLEARMELLHRLLRMQPCNLSQREIKSLASSLEGYSGSDIRNVCKEAAILPLRQLGASIQHASAKDIRGICFQDVKKSINQIKSSVHTRTIQELEGWNKHFGA